MTYNFTSNIVKASAITAQVTCNRIKEWSVAPVQVLICVWLQGSSRYDVAVLMMDHSVSVYGRIFY